MKRRHWDSKTKVKIVLEGLSGRPLSEICNEYGIPTAFIASITLPYTKNSCLQNYTFIELSFSDKRLKTAIYPLLVDNINE